MILSTWFKNDNNELLQRVQYDLYGKSLAVIVNTCKQAYLQAASTLEVHTEFVTKVSEIHRFDHRTIQFTHDALAAVYRYRFDDGAQMTFDDESADSVTHRYIRQWSNWLDEEVKRLTNFGEFVRNLIFAVMHSENAKGAEAENQLFKFLQRYYSIDDELVLDSY